MLRATWPQASSPAVQRWVALQSVCPGFLGQSAWPHFPPPPRRKFESLDWGCVPTVGFLVRALIGSSWWAAPQPPLPTMLGFGWVPNRLLRCQKESPQIQTERVLAAPSLLVCLLVQCLSPEDKVPQASAVLSSFPQSHSCWAVQVTADCTPC